jgi:AsmA protein
VAVSHFSIADDPNFSAQPFVQARQLDISLKLMPLLHKSIEIQFLRLRQPQVDLIRNPQGVWNFSSIGSGSTTRPQHLSLGKLVMQDGQLTVTDLQGSRTPSTFDHVNVSVSSFAPDHPFSISAAAHLEGPGEEEIKLQGHGGPIQHQEPGDTPFRGKLDLKQVALANLRPILPASSFDKTDGFFSGAVRINSKSGQLSASGDIHLENASVDGRALGYPVTLRFDVGEDVPAHMLTIRSAVLQMGGTPLAIKGVVDSKTAPAQLNLQVTANGVSAAAVSQLAAASGNALAPGARLAGTFNAAVSVNGPADNPAFSGTIQGQTIEVSGKDLPRPIETKSINLTLSPSEIRSGDFTVTSGGTSVTAQFTLQQYLAKTRTIDATLRAANAELPAILSMAKAYGVTALDKVSGFGTLGIDLHAAGPVRSLTSGIAGDLNGTVTLNLADVRYAGADIGHELATIAGLLGMHRQSQGFTEIQRMTGAIAIRNGIADTSNTEAFLDFGNANISGTANLVNQALDLRMTAVLSKASSQQAGGMNITGFLRTALANNQGELVIPVLVTGTFEHPHFAPDLQQVAQMRLKGLVPNFNNPASAVSGLLGNVLSQRRGQADRQQPATQNPLQQLQGILGSR